MSRYHDANGEPVYPEDVLDPEELAEYRDFLANRPARGGSDAMVRRARAEREAS